MKNRQNTFGLEADYMTAGIEKLDKSLRVECNPIKTEKESEDKK